MVGSAPSWSNRVGQWREADRKGNPAADLKPRPL
jgi:hypothetical protein